MDILSFILGIALVVVIGLSIVAVIAFVKVRKIEKRIESLETDIFRALEFETSAAHRKIDELQLALNLRLDNTERDIYSQLDSRLDKLENKLITKK
jgi:predicted Holliday junction resolvase-like endonuclease